MWDLFRAQAQRRSTTQSTSDIVATLGDEKEEAAEATTEAAEDVATGDHEEAVCETSPARMFAYVSDSKGRRKTGKLMAKVLAKSQNLGAFVSIRLGTGLNTWYHDSGTTMSQMTPKAIRQVETP